MGLYFYSKSVDDGRMERCLRKETETLITMSGVKRIGSVFFGGGTNTSRYIESNPVARISGP